MSNGEGMGRSVDLHLESMYAPYFYNTYTYNPKNPGNYSQLMVLGIVALLGEQLQFECAHSLKSEFCPMTVIFNFIKLVFKYVFYCLNTYFTSAYAFLNVFHPKMLFYFYTFH